MFGVMMSLCLFCLISFKIWLVVWCRVMILKLRLNIVIIMWVIFDWLCW